MESSGPQPRQSEETSVRRGASAARRHDIDWLRVIAIALLIVYHIVILFQPWAILIGFPQSPASLEWLWIPMSMLNIWRIPLLFAVSGMGVAFAMRRRGFGELLRERAQRILLPLVVGIFAIVPLHVLLLQGFYGQALSYVPGLGHLWFLANLVVYVLILAPLFYFTPAPLKQRVKRALSLLLAHPAGLVLFAIPFVAEALLVRPDLFSLYAFTPHGFWLGMVAFLLGYVFVRLGDRFWSTVRKQRFVLLTGAFALFFVRLAAFELQSPGWLMALESMTWLMAVFGLGNAYLNRESAVLRYLREASYPIYIIHMAFLYLGAFWILPLDWHPVAQLAAIVGIAFTGCYAAYELVLRRFRVLRPLFGLRKVTRSTPQDAVQRMPAAAPSGHDKFLPAGAAPAWGSPPPSNTVDE